jgi:hypothetical protein
MFFVLFYLLHTLFNPWHDDSQSFADVMSVNSKYHSQGPCTSSRDHANISPTGLNFVGACDSQFAPLEQAVGRS